MGARATGTAAEVARKPNQQRKIAVAATIVVLVVVAAIAGSSLLGNKESSSSSSSTLGTSDGNAGLTQVISLSNSTTPFVLRNSSVLIFPLVEPVGRLNTHVEGNFTVLSAGTVTKVQTIITLQSVTTAQSVITVQSGGTAEVLVMNETSYNAFLLAFHPVLHINYTAYENATNPGGENITRFYDSMPLTSGSFNASLPAVPGTYYMLFVNRSYTNTIVVAAQVNLVWQLPSSG